MQVLTKLPSFVLLLALFACGAPETDGGSASENTAPDAEQATAPAPAPDKAKKMAGLQIGDVAPDFNLEGTDGKMHSLANTMDANGEKPKGYVVTFTCNTCPYAKGYETRLVALHEKLSPMGYPVIAIQPNDITIKPDDSLEAMKVRGEEQGFGFAYVIDATQEIYPQYGATKTPEIYLLDADRVLRYHGAIDDSAQDPEGVSERYVEMAVAALEAGNTPEPAEVKAIGCGIKAK